MIRRYEFAPLEGITKAPFRRVWSRFFGGPDGYMIPFFSPTPQHLLTPRDRLELDPSENAGLPLTPQVMTCRAEDFLWASAAVADMGYREVNLNLGCPSGTVAAKGKGAGFLADPDGLDRFFETVFAKAPLPVSVKTRLGVRDPAEFSRLLEIFNRYPISRLTVHPRVKTEKYRGPIHWEEFAAALRESKNPVSYNGDLRTVGDVRAVESRFPALETVMIGRGAVADPAIFRKLRGGPGASREELQSFTAALYREYREVYGQDYPASQRMKEVWFYLIHLFDDRLDYGKQLRRSRGAAAYESIEAMIFRDLPLRDHTAGELV